MRVERKPTTKPASTILPSDPLYFGRVALKRMPTAVAGAMKRVVVFTGLGATRFSASFLYLSLRSMGRMLPPLTGPNGADAAPGATDRLPSYSANGICHLPPHGFEDGIEA